MLYIHTVSLNKQINTYLLCLFHPDIKSRTSHTKIEKRKLECLQIDMFYVR